MLIADFWLLIEMPPKESEDLNSEIERPLSEDFSLCHE